MNVIDLFAGCGGLSLGFMKAGYVVNKAVEFDPAIAQTYKVNHPEVNVIVDDITNVDTTGVFLEVTRMLSLEDHLARGFLWLVRESDTVLSMTQGITCLSIISMS